MIVALNLSPEAVAEHVRRESRQGRANAMLHSAAEPLYDQILDETCRQLVLALGQLADVQTATSAEILARLDSLLTRIMKAPELLFTQAKRLMTPRSPRCTAGTLRGR